MIRQKIKDTDMACQCLTIDLGDKSSQEARGDQAKSGWDN